MFSLKLVGVREEQLDVWEEELYEDEGLKDEGCSQAMEDRWVLWRRLLGTYAALRDWNQCTRIRILTCLDQLLW